MIQDPDNALSGCPQRVRWTSVSTVTLVLLTVAAAALRFRFLGRKLFWFDECFSAEVTRLSWHDFGMLLWRREANMSLYYLLLRGWLHFGFSTFFIRSLSVIISLAALPAIFWLAGKLFDGRVALLAVALMSFNAYHIRYAQEARSYALFVLLATLSSGFFVATLREPSRRNRWGYICASVLAVYAHLYALLLLAAQWLSVRELGRTRAGLDTHALRRSWIWIGLAVLPLVIFAAKTGAGPIRWIERPGLRDVLAFVEQIVGNDGVWLLLLYAVACVVAIMADPQGLKPASALTLGGTLRRASLAQGRRGTEVVPFPKMLFRKSEANPESNSSWCAWRLRFLLIWLIFPAALTLLLSLARPLFLGRYFIFCLPALVILAAAGLASLRRPWLMAVGLAAMLLLSLQGTFAYYDHDFDLERDDSQAAANYVLDHALAGDTILFHIAEARVPYEFFKSIRALGLPPGSVADGPEIIYPRHSDRLDYRDFTGKPARDFVQSLSGSRLRLWLVLMSNGTADNPDATTLMLDQTLGALFPQVERRQFLQVEVRFYSRP